MGGERKENPQKESCKKVYAKMDLLKKESTNSEGLGGSFISCLQGRNKFGKKNQ